MHNRISKYRISRVWRLIEFLWNCVFGTAQMMLVIRIKSVQSRRRLLCQNQSAAAMCRRDMKHSPRRLVERMLLKRSVPNILIVWHNPSHWSEQKDATKYHSNDYNRCDRIKLPYVTYQISLWNKFWHFEFFLFFFLLFLFSSWRFLVMIFFSRVFGCWSFKYIECDFVWIKYDLLVMSLLISLDRLPWGIGNKDKNPADTRKKSLKKTTNRNSLAFEWKSSKWIKFDVNVNVTNSF